MKKIINISLLIFVLVLWGTIIYRYLNNYFHNDSIVLKNNIKESSLTKINERDTFLLKTLRRDPFLSKTISVKMNSLQKNTVSNITKDNSKKIKIESKNTTPLVKPSIKYYGIIKSKIKNEDLVIVKINNDVHKLSKNSEKNGIIIQKISRDSILIMFNNKSEYIKRNKT